MLTLPPRHGSAQGATLPPGASPVIVVGANGAGKTRFTRRMRSDMRERAFSLSALHGIFERPAAPDPAAGTVSVESLYAASPMAELYREPRSQLECLLRLLLEEEVTALMTRKLRPQKGAGSKGATRLDKLIRLWREMFPGNNILLEGSRMLFSRAAAEAPAQDDEEEKEPAAGSAPLSYSAMTLSAGERAVLFYLAGMLFAPAGALVFVDDPTIFLHPTVATSLWEHLEAMRPDCTLIYTTHDLDFAASRAGGVTVWVRDYDAAAHTWDYELLPPRSGIPEEVYASILGSRRPVLFIEGDGVNSIDAKLYPLIFNDFTVKSLGSCNKVIEATRSFNDLKDFHHLESRGLVDRDRRDKTEVAYLRRKGIFVPDVAEVENLLLVEEVVRTVAASRGRSENSVAMRVKKAVMHLFTADYRKQALMHTRHRVKRLMEYRVDGRFTSITDLEKHINGLVKEINPRATYEALCKEFKSYLDNNDYASVLRVYNEKAMLGVCNVAGLCGLRDKKEYLDTILELLRAGGAPALRLRRAITACFHFAPDQEGQEGQP